MSKLNQFYDLLRRPHVTEKSTVLQGMCNQHAFRVAAHANKSEIKKAIEALFPVKVVKVNILNNPSKTRRTFGRPGAAPAWKKAIVTLRKGDTLETA